MRAITPIPMSHDVTSGLASCRGASIGTSVLADGDVIRVIHTDGKVAEWTFPADPGSVRAARTFVRSQLRAWGLEALGDVTALLVSELVTNADLHG